MKIYTLKRMQFLPITLTEAWDFLFTEEPVQDHAKTNGFTTLYTSGWDVDEQRFGPYALWQHQHHVKEALHGIEMTDEVNYAIPFGFLGQLANRMFVEQRLNVIFDHRFKMLAEYFGNDKTKIRKSA
jgi:ligand-binding SRPBCC domain-containing protein